MASSRLQSRDPACHKTSVLGTEPCYKNVSGSQVLDQKKNNKKGSFGRSQCSVRAGYLPPPPWRKNNFKAIYRYLT